MLVWMRLAVVVDRWIMVRYYRDRGGRGEVKVREKGGNRESNG